MPEGVGLIAHLVLESMLIAARSITIVPCHPSPPNAIGPTAGARISCPFFRECPEGDPRLSSRLQPRESPSSLLNHWRDHCYESCMALTCGTPALDRPYPGDYYAGNSPEGTPGPDD